MYRNKREIFFSHFDHKILRTIVEFDKKLINLTLSIPQLTLSNILRKLYEQDNSL